MFYLIINVGQKMREFQIKCIMNQILSLSEIRSRCQMFLDNTKIYQLLLNEIKKSAPEPLEAAGLLLNSHLGSTNW